jgi:hypothetical protein
MFLVRDIMFCNQAAMKDYHDLVVEGRREIYTIEG